MELSIGEFSRAARLPVRTIRCYQAEGILTPRRTDPDSGYRYYDDAAMERARVVKKLPELNFSIAEIRELLAGERPGAVGTALLECKVLELDETIARCRTARRELEEFAAYERRVEALAAELGRSVVERSADPVILGGFRVHGSYEELGRHLQAVLRRFGRWGVPLRRAPPPAAPAPAAEADRESGTWSVRSLPPQALPGHPAPGPLRADQPLLLASAGARPVPPAPRPGCSWRRSTSAAPECFCRGAPTSTSPRSAWRWPEP